MPFIDDLPIITFASGSSDRYRELGIDYLVDDNNYSIGDDSSVVIDLNLI